MAKQNVDFININVAEFDAFKNSTPRVMQRLLQNSGNLKTIPQTKGILA